MKPISLAFLGVLLVLTNCDQQGRSAVQKGLSGVLDPDGQQRQAEMAETAAEAAKDASAAAKDASETAKSATETARIANQIVQDAAKRQAAESSPPTPSSPAQ